MSAASGAERAGAAGTEQERATSGGVGNGAPGAGAADVDDASTTAGPDAALAGDDAGGATEPEGVDPSMAGAPPASPGTDRPASDISVEELLSLVETLTAERDANFEARARLQAEFENYRKRVAKQELDQTARAHEALAAKLLPTLDAFDAAMAQGIEAVKPLHESLLGTLEREGLCRLVPTGEAFDPNEHEAVLHEPAEAGEDHGVVVDVLRPGYAWKGRVIRAAMVKVRT